MATSNYRALHARVNTNTDTLLKRFEGIAALAPMSTPKPDSDLRDPKDKHAVAAEAYIIETHASAMIRAVEDLLALTKTMKEAWLFGQLGSGDEQGEAEAAERKADADAKVVGEGLREVLAQEIRSEDESAAM